MQLDQFCFLSQRGDARVCFVCFFVFLFLFLLFFVFVLVPCEQMLNEKQFLLGNRPLFVDFDLFGMLGNFLYSGHYELPAAHSQLRAWHARMQTINHGVQ